MNEKPAMFDWEEYRKQVQARIADLARLSPGTMRGYRELSTAGARSEQGATKEEIAEALGVAVAVNAGAALVYSARVLDAYEAKPDTTASSSRASDTSARSTAKGGTGKRAHDCRNR